MEDLWLNIAHVKTKYILNGETKIQKPAPLILYKS